MRRKGRNTTTIAQMANNPYDHSPYTQVHESRSALYSRLVRRAHSNVMWYVEFGHWIIRESIVIIFVIACSASPPVVYNN